MCKVTVILPLYEFNPEVKRAILSVDRQSIREDVELIVLDMRSDKDKKERLDIASCSGDRSTISKIIPAEMKKSHQAFNEAAKTASGEYLLFLAQNCVLTKNILEILYSHAQKNDADVLIGNMAKQRGKSIDVESVLRRKMDGNETFNLAGRKDILTADMSLYNKFMKRNIVKASGAMFEKTNTNRSFLTQIETCAQKVFLINREICLCGDKRIYEYRRQTVKDYARVIARKVRRAFR